MFDYMDKTIQSFNNYLRSAGFKLNDKYIPTPLTPEQKLDRLKSIRERKNKLIEDIEQYHKEVMDFLESEEL